ncbi:hypothetical protein HY417_01920 [Candidatus Kaiserbacteria bacterium]|nr:hypothetical protein [Candidatus Kaiserbacteria bacterium]
MRSIQEVWVKIKNWMEEAVAEWGMIAIVVFLGLATFGLGRLSALEEARPAVSIQVAATDADARAMTIGGLVVASRSGNAYHFPWCPGAATMKETNKIWFESEEAARAAGYSPAKNCKGLQ